MMAKEKSLRLFYALWPDDATRAALIRLQAALPGRITPPEDLHLTLAFLGSQPAATLPARQALLTELPAAAMTLRLDYLGFFPKNGIVWSGIQQPPPALAALRQTLLAALAQQGVGLDQSAHFKPHVTLARDALATVAAADMAPILWRADHIALVQSSTGSTPRYRLLASRRLQEPA